MAPPREPAGIRLGIVRGISYGLFGPPDRFVAPARELGAGLLRAYVFWSQVEPEPHRYVWDAVDALLDQLDGDEEVWITVCSSSPWATRTPSTFLPPSPARDLAAYEAFVGALVRRCAGRVHYWQCDNEPSNTALLWAGTADEYVRQLRALRRAVAAADPSATVVLGGCGYDVLSSPEGSEPRRFFDQVLARAGDGFDLFDVHLYGDPVRIPEYVETVRGMMRAHGCERPIVAGEYNGPAPYEFPDAVAAMEETMMAAFAAAPPDPGADAEPPERRAMRALYDRMPELPDTLRMFMAGCPPELDDLRARIGRRGLVMRNLLALSLGIRRTACWNLAPEIPDYDDPLQMMHLMFATFALMDYDAGEIRVRRPTADTFALLTTTLAGVTSVDRLPAPDADLHAFDVVREGRPPLLVLWHQRDQVRGEQMAPMTVEWPWPHPRAHVTDAFGADHPCHLAGGRLRLAVSITPLFVSAG